MGLAFMATAPTAHAHAAFVSSDPEPGERLESAPGTVVLAFTEPVNTRLSRVVVTDPTGRSFETTTFGQRSMSVRLETNAPGVYEVRWATTSPLDGHALRGSFEFGVGVTPRPAEETAGVGGLDRTGAALALARALEYAGLLTAGGMLLLATVARRAPPLDWVRPRLHAACILALVGGVSVVLGEAFMAAGGLSGDAVTGYLAEGSAGWARVARIGLEALAVVSSRFAFAYTAAPVALSLGALAAAGHAAALRPAWWGVFW
ncbi:MAG: copper resistance CopC family protein, partial [Candidatus Binatia bacterium]